MKCLGNINFLVKEITSWYKISMWKKKCFDCILQIFFLLCSGKSMIDYLLCFNFLSYNPSLRYLIDWLIEAACSFSFLIHANTFYPTIFPLPLPAPSSTPTRIHFLTLKPTLSKGQNFNFYPFNSSHSSHYVNSLSVCDLTFCQIMLNMVTCTSALSRRNLTAACCIYILRLPLAQFLSFPVAFEGKCISPHAALSPHKII